MKLRIPLFWIQLGLIVLSALLTLIAGWYVLSAFLGMGTYIQSVMP